MNCELKLIDFHTHKPTAEGVITPRSFGIHPWHVDEVEAYGRDQFLDRYGNELADAEIIGECGLDKACSSSWQRQETVFRWQAEFAAELGRPMVIHCVRAFNEVFDVRRTLLKRHKTLPVWVIHGFASSLQISQQLYGNGIWVSFGAAILDPKHEKVRQCLAAIETPFFLETDDSDIGIAEIYHSTAELRNCSIPELAETIKEHFFSLVMCK